MHCVRCHGEEEAEGMRMDQYEEVLEYLEVNDAANSAIYEHIISDDEDEKIDHEDFEEKPQRIKVQRTPKQPSTREREEHEVTHMPYRTWCKFCVSGRGIASHHHVKRAEEGEEGKLPTIGMDYLYKPERNHA